MEKQKTKKGGSIAKNHTGLRVGKLVVLRRNPYNSPSGRARWDCECDCGGKTTVLANLLTSQTKTCCGCSVIHKVGRPVRNSNYQKLSTIEEGDFELEDVYDENTIDWSL